MQNKTPILVLTGLAIVAAAAIAGLTRDQWMGEKPQTVATAPEAPKTAEQPATTAPAASGEAQTQTQATAPAAQATAEQPASTSAQPAQQTTAAAPAQTAAPAQETAPAQQTASAQQTAPAQPPAQSEQPAATNAAPQPKVPTFDTVRVEKTGEAVIAGRAGAGADVVVKLDGQAIGKSTANEDGAFVVVPEKPLPAGSGALTVEAKGKGDLNPTASEQSVAVIVPAGGAQEALVAVVSPDQPTRVLQKPAAPEAAPAKSAEKPAEKPAKLVSIDAVDYDSAGNIVFSGQGEQGNTARIYIDNNMVGDAAVGPDGHWTFSGTADVKPGVHTLRVDGLDSAGKVLNRVEVPFFREQQNKVAEATQPAPATQAAQSTQPAQATQPAATSTQQQTQPAQTEATQAATQETTQKAVDTEAATAPAETATPAQPKEGRVVIQPGNNLWRISRVLYGQGNKYTMLYKANKDQIRNPNLIYPGQIFKTPEIAAKAESIDPKRRAPLTDEEHTHTAQ